MYVNWFKVNTHTFDQKAKMTTKHHSWCPVSVSYTADWVS